MRAGHAWLTMAAGTPPMWHMHGPKALTFRNCCHDKAYVVVLATCRNDLFIAAIICALLAQPNIATASPFPDQSIWQAFQLALPAF